MSFATETKVKAVRKPHRCDGCRKLIEIGRPAVRWAGMTDGDFAAVIFHPECREAEIGLNKLMGSQYGDEWAGLDDIEAEDWPWLRETHPAVADRLGILLPPADVAPQAHRNSDGQPSPGPTQNPNRISLEEGKS